MEALQEGQSEVDSVVVKLRKARPKVTGGLLRMREAAFADGLFPSKVKALSALALSVAIRCEPCIETYVEMVLEEGATYEEVVEFLNVVMAMQGCPGEAWALRALKRFDRLEQGLRAPLNGGEPAACCDE